jgi:hypothetical protein
MLETILRLGNKPINFIFFHHIKSHVCFGLPCVFGGNTFIPYCISPRFMKMHEIHAMGKTNYFMRLTKATYVKFIWDCMSRLDD